MPRGSRPAGLDLQRAAEILESYWQGVVAEAMAQPQLAYAPDAALRQAIADSVNHRLVTYRFCLPIQLLGKMTNPAIDCLKLQRGDGSDSTAWDARSMGSKVLCEFNRKQEAILGDSSDPYVSKPHAPAANVSG